MPLFSAALRYTTLRMLGLTCCKIDDRALQYLGIGIRENQHLELLLIMDNYFTAKGLLRFLIFLINEKSVLECVIINSEPFNFLIRRTGYSYIISQINHIRRIFSKKSFSVRDGGHKQDAATKFFQSAAAQVVELPAPFSRRHVL